MLTAGAGGGPSNFVGIDMGRAAGLARELERVAAELQMKAPRLQRLVDQAGGVAVGAGSIRVSPVLLAAGRWAESTAADLRWRIQAVQADPWAASWSGDSMLLALLEFPDRAAMVAAATGHAARLRRLLSIAGSGPFEVDAERLQRTYPELVRELRLAAGHAAADPLYAAALVEALGTSGTRTVLDLAIASMHDQMIRGRGNDDGRVPGEDAVADLVRPFAEVFAAATRSGSPGMAAIQGDILGPRTPVEFHHLSFLLNAGRASTQFTVDAATVLLRDEKGLGRAGITVLPFFSPWPDLEVTDLSATRALERNAEASFRFVTTGTNSELILRLDQYPPIGDRRGLQHSAGRVLELGLFEWPSRNPANLAAARGGFDRIVASVAADGVPDPVKRSLAGVSALHLDGLTGRVDRTTLSRFFGELARDDHALSVLSLALGLYARDQLASGLHQVVSADLSVLPPMGEMGEELERVSALYGAVGSGIVMVVADDEAAVRRLVAGLRFSGDAAAGIGLAASSVSGPAGAATGIGIRFLIGKGAEGVGRMAASGNPDVETYLGDVVSPGLRRLVALELYANDATRGDVRAVPPPPERLEGGRLAVPPPSAPDHVRRAFWSWFDDWYADPANRSLRDQTETLAGQIEARIVDDVLLTDLRK